MPANVPTATSGNRQSAGCGRKLAKPEIQPTATPSGRNSAKFRAPAIHSLRVGQGPNPFTGIFATLSTAIMARRAHMSRPSMDISNCGRGSG